MPNLLYAPLLPLNPKIRPIIGSTIALVIIIGPENKSPTINVGTRYNKAEIKKSSNDNKPKPGAELFFINIAPLLSYKVIIYILGKCG